jgi:hypothetical protein
MFERAVSAPAAGGFTLSPEFARAVAPRGPGKLGNEGVAGALLFDTVGMSRLDLIARFFATEAGALDWRADFMRSNELDSMVQNLDEKLDIEEEIEEVYARSELTTTGTDVDSY